ncbi:ABC transporter ATP-binding protein [Thermodesulfobacteriota bacterium]
MSSILKLNEVCKYFPVSSGGVFRKKTRMLKAVDGVSFSIKRGTSFALARLVLLLEKPTRGTIQFEDKNLKDISNEEEILYRSRVQTVLQDAAGSLNPRMRIKEILNEGLKVQNKSLTKSEILQKAEEILPLTGLSTAVLNNYPHELSGGQKQRVAIARVLVLNPSLIILDEPVSSLDISIRAQILNLLADIQDEFGLTYFIIAHDLAMLGHVSSRIAIMYLGRIVEIGDTEEIYANPLHPYTKALFLAVPRPTPDRKRQKASLTGEIGSPLDIASGCRFHPRCEYTAQECRIEEHPLIEVNPNHLVACHRFIS